MQSAKSLYKLLVYKKVQSKTYKIVSKIDVYKKLGDVLMTLGEPRLAFIFYQKNDMVY